MNDDDPHGIVGYEVPAADGGDYGHRVLGYDPATGDYRVEQIRWSDNAAFLSLTARRIDQFKISYRYDLSRKRETRKRVTEHSFTDAPAANTFAAEMIARGHTVRMRGSLVVVVENWDP